MSSSCLKCSLGEDIFVFLLVKMGVLGVLLTLLFRVVKRSVYLYGFILIFLLSTLYYINYRLFVDRVAAWSTYSFEETWITIFWNSAGDQANRHRHRNIALRRGRGRFVPARVFPLPDIYRRLLNCGHRE